MYITITYYSTLWTLFQECQRSDSEDSESVFSIINAFDIPKFFYNEERKKFLPEEKNTAQGEIQYVPCASFKSSYMQFR